MNITRVMLAGAIVALLGGCSDDPDLSGLYEVTYHTFSADNCDVEGDAVDTPLYFRMDKDKFFGVDIFTFSGCDSATDPDCNSPAMLVSSFTQPIDNGWKGVVSYTSWSGTDCSLGYVEGTAVLEEGGIRIETRRWADQVQLPEGACTTDEAESRGKQMPCDGYEVIVGATVPE